MPKTMKFAARVVAACGVAIACASASAAVAAPKGTLTGAEYRQLSAGMAALDKSVGARSVNWGRARAACRAVGGDTDLLRTQRASCFASVAALESLASFPSEQRRCSRSVKSGAGTTTTGTTTTGTATTGTTTSPIESRVIRVLVCMSPRYDALARHSRQLDTEAIAARRSALARGFAGSCLAALARTPAELRTAKLFSSSTRRLAADVGLLIKVTEGRAPSSDFNQTKIDNDVRQFENSASAVLDERGQPKLAACPHK